jgi:hypothetical protein
VDFRLHLPPVVITAGSGIVFNGGTKPAFIAAIFSRPNGLHALMLDAFIRKGVRKILARSGREHTNEMNEDAITSMVFTPLRFMEPNEALNCLRLILTRQLAELTRSRGVSSFSLQFWPIGLHSNSTIGAKKTRCEPDLLVNFEFNEGPPVIIIGEMKWDSYPSKAQLEAQILRERNAIKESNPKADVLMFAFVKFKKPYMDVEGLHRAGCQVFEWAEFHQILNRYLGLSPAQDSVQRRWASDISEFLIRAEQMVFTGFNENYGHLPAADLGPVFYRRGFRGFSINSGKLPAVERQCFYLAEGSNDSLSNLSNI